MTKEILIDHFLKNHFELTDYVNSLSESDFMFSMNNKWTAGQQIKHISLCLLPIDQALTSKDFLEKKFGKVDRPSLEYESVLSNYKSALESGGKAPEKFVPEKNSFLDKQELIKELKNLLHSITNKLENYAEIELDSFVLPHPLLGMMTLREFFYLMSFHGTHHLEQTKMNNQRLNHHN